MNKDLNSASIPDSGCDKENNWLLEYLRNGSFKDEEQVWDLALTFLLAGDFSNLIIVMEYYLEMDCPRRLEAMFALGSAYYEVERKEAAIAMWEKAYCMAPQNPTAMTALGLIKMCRGN